MRRILRILLVVILFIVFFEIGIFSSYTIVTTEVPNIDGLVNMQVTKISSVFNPQKVNDMLVKDPVKINISNTKDVALKMEEVSNVDGVNIESMNVTTYDDLDNEKINVTIEALGYSSPNSTSGQIIISQNPSYKVIVDGVASYKSGKLSVDVDSIKVNSILKLY